MNKILIILALVIFSACGLEQSSYPDKKIDSKQVTLDIDPFELIVFDYNYSMAYALQYILTDKELKITFKGELEEENDSVLFLIDLPPNEVLLHLSRIDLDSLYDYYSNPCIFDGSQISIDLKKGGITKRVQLSNFYHPDIGLAIDMINNLTPTSYKIWYDKEVLVQGLTDCDEGVEIMEIVHDDEGVKLIEILR